MTTQWRRIKRQHKAMYQVGYFPPKEILADYLACYKGMPRCKACHGKGCDLTFEDDGSYTLIKCEVCKGTGFVPGRKKYRVRRMYRRYSALEHVAKVLMDVYISDML